MRQPERDSEARGGAAQGREYGGVRGRPSRVDLPGAQVGVQQRQGGNPVGSARKDPAGRLPPGQAGRAGQGTGSGDGCGDRG